MGCATSQYIVYPQLGIDFEVSGVFLFYLRCPDSQLNTYKKNNNNSVCDCACDKACCVLFFQPVEEARDVALVHLGDLAGSGGRAVGRG